jgi:hypothetical protein
MADLMRSRTASDPHVATEGGYVVGTCWRCWRPYSNPIHWSREEDKAEMKRRWDRMNAQWAA